MAAGRRKDVSAAGELAALAHPVRLDLLNYLMANGPATASACARAVGDTPSNCSYHLRYLARYGLVEAQDGGDGRERPWRAKITGFGVDVENADPEQVAALGAIALQRDQRLAREHFARRNPRWQGAAGIDTYTLRMTPEELADLSQKLDVLIRPYIAATREDSPKDSALVHLGLHAFPIEES